MSQELSDKEISDAFDKLKITLVTESSIEENSDDLDNGMKIKTLDIIDKLRGRKKRPDIDSIFDFLYKTVATNIDKYTLTDSIPQLITQKVLVNKKTPNGYDSLYLSNFDQREIDHTPESKSDKKDDYSVQILIPNIPKETAQFQIQSETTLLQNVKQIIKPSAKQRSLTFDQFEMLITPSLRRKTDSNTRKI